MTPLRFVALLLAAAVLFPAVASAQALPVFDQGRVYRTEADFQRATQPYQAAITADARNARAHYWLGFAYLFGYRLYRGGMAPYASGFISRALASLRRSVELDGAFMPALVALHDALILAGDADAASALLQAIAQRNRPAGLPYNIP